jgi:DNA-dependent RNA polymerase auxiliary subunit epsilon
MLNGRFSNCRMTAKGHTQNSAIRHVLSDQVTTYTMNAAMKHALSARMFHVRFIDKISGASPDYPAAHSRAMRLFPVRALQGIA